VASRLRRWRSFVWSDYGLFLAAVIPLAVVFSYLNWHAPHGFHTLAKHVVFRDRILHGFATGVVDPNYPTPPTFPMWGMGFVILPTTSLAYIDVVNFGLGISSFLFLLRTLEREGVVGILGRRVALAAVAVLLPWYAYHSIAWSQSINFSLFMLGAALLVRRRFVLSGLAFGLGLNVQSDYIGLFPLFALGWLLVARDRVAVARSVATWGATMLVCLIPWAVYSHHATGHVLLTSSNAGHVFYISLGQTGLYDIQFRDGSKQMYAVLDRKIHPPVSRFYGSCTPEASNVLLREWWRIVSSDPLRFVHGMLIKARNTPAPYPGEFRSASSVRSIRRAVQSVSHGEARVYSVLSVLVVIMGIILAVTRRSLALSFVVATILFRFLLNFVAQNEGQYLSDLIPLCAILAGVIVEAAGRRQESASRIAPTW
jgi:hypothetical protein